jgi:hypothetical protein
MTARKINCSTECPLDGTPRATLRELLEDYRTSKNSSARGQHSTEQGPVQNEYRTSTRQGMIENDRY